MCLTMICHVILIFYGNHYNMKHKIRCFIILLLSMFYMIILYYLYNNINKEVLRCYKKLGAESVNPKFSEKKTENFRLLEGGGVAPAVMLTFKQIIEETIINIQ